MKKLMVVIGSEVIEEEGDIPAGTWVWCLHCERCYRQGEARYRRGGYFGPLALCPYKGCGGDTVLDCWLWLKIRSVHPEYPEIPERGKVYPLYS